MTIEERNKKLKAYITCLKCEVRGRYCSDDCSTQYEAGNMGEIIENLEAINNLVSKLEFGMTELKLASEVIPRGSDYSDGWCDCIDGMRAYIDKGYRMIRKDSEVDDAIYRYTRAKETIKENCYVFNIGDLDESARINKALDLACTAIDIIIGELEGEKE